ncbi:MAG: sugar transferase [Paracoccaceae bacterium]
MSFDGKPSTNLDLANAPVQHSRARHPVASPQPRAYFNLPKRAFDIAFALFLLPVVLPFIAFLWLLVKLDGGPGFFGHVRVGRGGHTFRCYKLRTMVPDAEIRLKAHLSQNPQAAAAWAQNFKLEPDPRVTRIGRVLRKTSLDELPQIWNVLKGEMSFVGPRPVTAPELLLYGARAGFYKSLRPGITGLWQVSGRNAVSYERRVEMDEEYFHTGSLLTDVGIIARTGSAVFGMTGN